MKCGSSDGGEDGDLNAVGFEEMSKIFVMKVRLIFGTESL